MNGWTGTTVVLVTRIPLVAVPGRTPPLEGLAGDVMDAFPHRVTRSTSEEPPRPVLPSRTLVGDCPIRGVRDSGWRVPRSLQLFSRVIHRKKSIKTYVVYFGVSGVSWYLSFSL